MHGKNNSRAHYKNILSDNNFEYSDILLSLQFAIRKNDVNFASNLTACCQTIDRQMLDVIVNISDDKYGLKLLQLIFESKHNDMVELCNQIDTDFIQNLVEKSKKLILHELLSKKRIDFKLLSDIILRKMIKKEFCDCLSILVDNKFLDTSKKLELAEFASQEKVSRKIVRILRTTV